MESNFERGAREDGSFGSVLPFGHFSAGDRLLIFFTTFLRKEIDPGGNSSLSLFDARPAIGHWRRRCGVDWLRFDGRVYWLLAVDGRSCGAEERLLFRTGCRSD
jgi:hypothetical protein